MTPLDQIGKKYATVVIDPPWYMPPSGLTGEINGRKSPHTNPLPYEGMTIEQIAAMPVASVLETDCTLFLWTVNKFIRDAFDILDQWGLKYSFTMTWMKTKGIQYPGSPCFNTEWIVVGKQGKPKFLSTVAFSAGNIWKSGGHSEKPEGFYDLLRRVSPAPRLDIFGRRRIAGFDSWGDEAPDSPALPDHYQTPMFLGE